METTVEQIWRSGSLMVVRKGAELPDRCVKTNQPANGKRFKASLYWHPSILYILILANLILYVIVAVCVRKTAIVYLGVTEEILRQRRRAITVGWATGLSGLVLFFFALSVQSESLMGLLLLLGLALMLGGLIGGITKATLVGVDHMAGDYIWIRGVSKDYLALLPEWQPALLKMNGPLPNIG